MAEYLGALIYDSSINLAGLERDKNAAIAKLHSIGAEATKTFQNDIARALAKSVRPEVFAGDLAKSRALLDGFGNDATKIFDRALGRQAAKRLFAPFIDESKTLAGQLKGILASNFDPKNFILGAVGGFGLATLGTELVRFGKDSVVFASDFETSLTKIKTIADRGTDIEKIGDELETLSTRIPQDLLTLSEGLFNIIGSGINDSAEALKVLDVAARAATAGFTDTKFAADAIVFAINAFGKSADDAEEIANVLFKTVDVGKIEFSQLAANIGEVANPAAIAGVSLQELGQAIATITLGGTPVAETFTSLKNLLQSIIAPTEGARKAAEALGLDFSKAGIAAAGGLENFLQKIRGVTGGDTQKLDKLFPEARALRAAQILTNTLADTYVRLGNEFANTSKKSGEMQKAFDDVNDSATAQATIFTNNLKLATLELGKGFLEVLKPALQAVNQGFIENEKAVGNYVKSVIGFTKLLGNPQLAAILGFGSFLKGGQPAANIPVLDEVQVVAERLDKAKEQASEAERELKARKEIKKVIEDEIQLVANSGFNNFKDSFNAQIKARFTIPEFEVDEEAFGAFKKSFQAKTKELFKGEFPPTEEDIRRSEEKRRRLQQEFVYLADAIDRGLGDVAASLFSFIDTLRDSNASIVGKLAGGLNLFSSAFSVFNGLFSGLNRQNDLERAQHFREAEEARRLEEERLLDIGRQLTDQYEKLSDALLGFGVQSLQNQFLEIQDSIKNLIGTTRDLTEEQIRQILSVQSELKRVNEEISALLRSGEDVPQELLEKQKQLTDELAKLGGSLNDLTAEQILRLNELFKESGLVKNALDNFGKFANDFSGLINQLNFSFDVLNIDDPVQKLASLQKEIEKKFKAIIPTTEAGIRDLITQGVAALEAGGQTLIDFLKSRDLEELTAEQFRDLLQLLNNLANEAKSKVAGITDAASESVISQVRLATFDQTNALIDNTVTMRIVLTNILDAERQMLELARRNIGLTGSGAVVPSTRDRFFFFNDGVISETSAAALSQLQRKMYNDALAAAGGKGLS